MNAAWWHTPVTPSALEAEMGGSDWEFQPTWATWSIPGQPEPHQEPIINPRHQGESGLVCLIGCLAHVNSHGKAAGQLVLCQVPRLNCHSGPEEEGHHRFVPVSFLLSPPS